MRNATLGPALANQAYVTVGASLLTLVLAIPAAFALARSKGRIGILIERTFSLGFLIPGFAALVPTAMLAIWFGLFHTREFLIIFLPASAMPLSVILLTQAMRAVPKELEESAVLDGAGSLRLMWSVYFPLSLPTLVVVAILKAISEKLSQKLSGLCWGTAIRALRAALPRTKTPSSGW